MNFSTPFRIVVAFASACITLILFAGVASLADEPHDRAETHLASLPTAAVPKGPLVRKLARASSPKRRTGFLRPDVRMPTRRA
jgi:hypothetical protein